MQGLGGRVDRLGRELGQNRRSPADSYAARPLFGGTLASDLMSDESHHILWRHVTSVLTMPGRSATDTMSGSSDEMVLQDFTTELSC